MCWYGIPPSIRGKAWLALLGNDLKITPGESYTCIAIDYKVYVLINFVDLYRILSARAQEAARHAVKPDDPNGSREDSMSIIDVDVPRTFPELKVRSIEQSCIISAAPVITCFI